MAVRPRRVDAGDVVTHLEGLLAADMSARSISLASGVSRNTLDRLLAGSQQLLRQDVARRLLAVNKTSGPKRVPSGPTVALVEAMEAAGVKRQWIAQQLGRSSRTLEFGKTVSTARAAAVEALADQVLKARPRLEVDDVQLYASLDAQALVNRALGALDLSWMDRGQCRDIDTGVFYPDDEADLVATAPAVAMCSTCDVREPCLHFALESDQQGLWAGTSTKDRRRLRKRARRLRSAAA